MAAFLYRLGRWVFRHPWRVVGSWILAVGVILGLGIGLGGKLQESFAIPGTESQQAIDTLAEVFPQTAGASARAVVQVPEGDTVSEEPYRAAIEELTAELAQVDGVENAVSPFSEFAGKAISDDERTAFVQVQFDGPTSEVTPASLKQVVATVPIATDVGMDVSYGGEVFQDTTFGLTVTEVIGVLFAAVVLLVTFGSLLAAGMPLLSALIGVAISFGAVAIASAFMTISSASPMLAVMLGLAVGIDYSLFILSRHRNNLARGMDPEESTAQSIATSGSAVVFAGLTVIIALLGLLVVGIPFLSVMGVGAAFAVLVAIAAATTLLPAILGIAGRRLIPRPGSRASRRALASDEGGKKTLGRRWIDSVLKAPVFAALAVIAILGTIALPALSLQLNLPTSASEPQDSTQYKAFKTIEEGFGPGYNGPLVAMVDITQTTDVMEDLGTIAERIREVPGVEYVADGIPNATVDTAIIRVIPETAPDDPATKELVQRLRELAPQMEEELGTPIAVTGYTAVSIDISNRLASSLVPFALTIVGLSVLLLLMVFRSVFVPIKAALGFILSAGAAIGASVAVFQWGWGAELLHVEHVGPILSFLPVLLIALLFGLAMDYEVFLVSGMREEYVRSQPRSDWRGAIVHGFQHAARVVTAAALIMFFVFFAFVPEGSGAIKGIAFALAVGVFFDAFLVRMTLGPALMAMAKSGAWWLPAWLDRILPNVDIEGESLRHSQEAHWWATAEDCVVSAENAVVEYRDDTGMAYQSHPVSFHVDNSHTALVTGSSRERRLLLLALAGRYPLAAGRAQLTGLEVSTETRRLARSARVVDLEADVARADVTGVDPISSITESLRSAFSERPRVLLIALPDGTPDQIADLAALIIRRVPSNLPLVLSGPGLIERADWPQRIERINLNPALETQR